jgi:hypothetical protein
MNLITVRKIINSKYNYINYIILTLNSYIYFNNCIKFKLSNGITQYLFQV